MFELKYQGTFDAAIFLKYGIPESAEDYYEVDNTIFCVADGVTRDPIDGVLIPFPNTKEEVEYLCSKYPNPSGALEASKICAKEFIKEVKKIENISKETILEAAKKANQAIWEINKNRKIDYVVEDLYCCEAVGGIICEDKLYCFSIGDCHITALDENLNVVFTTINNHLEWDIYEREVLKKQDPEKYDWKKPEYRALVRSHYRNHIGQIYEGKEISYGAFTGEKLAEDYIDVYEVDLKNVKYICAYSDGCEPNFETKEERKKLIDNPDGMKEKGAEKTLVIYEKK